MPRSNRGFTLVEILVVMFIVSVLVGLSTLAVRGRDVQALVDEDAERLLQLLTLAQEESLFRFRTLGLWVYRSGYRFFEYRDDHWLGVADDRLLKARQTDAPESVLRLYLEGRPVVLEVEEPEKEGALVPQVVFFPDGAATPFELVIEAPGAESRSLKGGASGRLWRGEDDGAR